MAGGSSAAAWEIVRRLWAMETCHKCQQCPALGVRNGDRARWPMHCKKQCSINLHRGAVEEVDSLRSPERSQGLMKTCLTSSSPGLRDTGILSSNPSNRPCIQGNFPDLHGQRQSLTNSCSKFTCILSGACLCSLGLPAASESPRLSSSLSGF